MVTSGAIYSHYAHYGISIRIPQLDVCELDYLRPLINFVSDELTKVGWIHEHWNAAHIDHARPQRGIRQASIGLLVELFDDDGRRMPRRMGAKPHTCLVAWHKITHRRHIWQYI